MRADDPAGTYQAELDRLALLIVGAIGEFGSLEPGVIPDDLDGVLEQAAIRVGLAARNRHRPAPPVGGCRIDPTEDWCPWCVPPEACADAVEVARDRQQP